MTVEADKYKGMQNSMLNTCIWHSVGTYSDQFEHWKITTSEMQKTILAIHTDRIDRMNDGDQKATTATQWDPETVINNEEV